MPRHHLATKPLAQIPHMLGDQFAGWQKDFARPARSTEMLAQVQKATTTFEQTPKEWVVRFGLVPMNPRLIQVRTLTRYFVRKILAELNLVPTSFLAPRFSQCDRPEYNEEQIQCRWIVVAI